MRRIQTLVVCALALASGAALAQAYPSRPIKFLVPFSPGSGTDIIARTVGEAMSKNIQQPVVVENKPGAGGTIGNEQVARAEKDGYTLGIMTAGQIIAAVMNKSLRYDTATAFEPISLVGTASLMLVARADFPATNVNDLIAAAKASPGKINLASPGFGATQHMSGELFKQMAGVDMLSVQFRTTPEAVTALLGKQVDILFDTVLAVIGQVQSGQLKAIGVTSKDRFPLVPNVPAIAESAAMADYNVTTWYGVFSTAGVPKPVVAKLNATLNEVLKEEAVREKLNKAGVTVQGSTPEAFGKFMADELARWNKVREAAGIAQQ